MKLVLLGIALGCLMPFEGLLAGVHADGPYACPGCAVLSRPFHQCNEAVVGGWICP